MIDDVYQRIRKKEDQLQSIPAGVDFENVASVEKLQEEGVTYETLRYLKFLGISKENKWVCSWNWAAFAFGEFWLVYRRAYKEAFFFFLLRILFVLTVLGITMFFGIGFEGAYDFASMLSVGAMFVIAKWGDAMYMQAMHKKMEKNKNIHPKASKVAILMGGIILIIFMIGAMASIIALKSSEISQVENIDGGKYESE